MQTPPPSQDPAATPPPAGYPHPPVGPTIRFDVIGQAFNMVFADIGTWVTAALLLVLVAGVGTFLAFLVLGTLLAAIGGVFGFLISIAVMAFVGGALGNIMLANMYRMAIMALSGIKPSVNEMFRFGPNVGNIVIASFLVAIITAVGYAICYIPGFIAGGLLMFTIPLVVDRAMPGADALKASFETLKKDAVMATVFFFVVSLCAGLGSIALGIGVVFTLPVLPLAVTMLYRDYMGFASPVPDAVVPATPAP